MIDTAKLLRYSNFDYLVFDYETCNLNLQSPDNKPWQVSMLLKNYNFVGGKHVVTEIDRMDVFLKWDDLNLSSAAEIITRFNRKKYNENALYPGFVLDDLNRFLYDDHTFIVMHNGIGFDIYIHNIFRLLMGMDPDYSYMNKILDTHALSKLYKLDMTKPEEMSLDEWQIKIMNTRARGLRTNVKAMCKEFGIEVDEDLLHDPMYDVEKTDEIFLNLIWKLEI